MHDRELHRYLVHAGMYVILQNIARLKSVNETHTHTHTRPFGDIHDSESIVKLRSKALGNHD